MPTSVGDDLPAGWTLGPDGALLYWDTAVATISQIPAGAWMWEALPATGPCLAERGSGGCADEQAAVRSAVRVLHPPLSGRRTTTGYTLLSPARNGRVPSYCTVALPRHQWAALRAEAAADHQASTDVRDQKVYGSIIGLADHALASEAARPAVLISVPMGRMLRTGGYYAPGTPRRPREPRSYLPEPDDHAVHEWLNAYKAQETELRAAVD
ncbi:hypothetical protein [Streptomyces nanshensis]|uniref:Uncharacterized protein n=1 Tax=Streptomyces nanshensis TaxID=518642 RepID=A0A1E7LA08_9ACTN|nr:hypothetical protein [Streptomyces nanshensis]OEV12988.1 hypothetical protein AN218_05620 [Streptomyces nanshensis]